jgi:hypothetical protein
LSPPAAELRIETHEADVAASGFLQSQLSSQKSR